jgi:glycerol-3-phosphate responsive antiterminator
VNHLSVIFYIGKSIGNKNILISMDLLTGKAQKKYKITRFILSVFPSGRLSYNQNTICNYVGDYLKIFLKNLFNKTRK